MAEEPVLLQARDGNVVTLTLNRPQARNALSRALAEALRTAAEALAADHTVRAVLVRGAPPAFCAGADLRERLDLPPDALTAHTQAVRAAVEAVAQLPMPTIAVIAGPCLAGGLELALACDVRFASTTATFGLPEVRRGIFPAAGGILRLPAVVGPSRAADLILSGRIIDAEEAFRIGLIDRLCPPEALEDTVAAYLAELAQTAPLAVRAAKAALAAARPALSPEALATIDQLRAALDATEDYQEGLRAFRERRPPRFTGR